MPNIIKINKSDIDFNNIYGNSTDAMANNGNTVKVDSNYWGDSGDLYFDTDTGLVTENGIGLGYTNALNTNSYDISTTYIDNSLPVQNEAQLNTLTQAQIAENAFSQLLAAQNAAILDNQIPNTGVADNNALFQQMLANASNNSTFDPLAASNTLDASIKGVDMSMGVPDINNFSIPSLVDANGNFPSPPTVDPNASILNFVPPNNEMVTDNILNYVPISGADPSAIIPIPSTVPQTGVTRNYTNYSYFYGKWSKGTAQRALSEQWNAAGRTSNRGIATLNGRYLVALSPKFGNVGQNVNITLENGEVIPATIADAKGSDAQSEWGHRLGNGIDIIEWESFGSKDNIDISGWQGVKVSSITKV